MRAEQFCKGQDRLPLVAQPPSRRLELYFRPLREKNVEFMSPLQLRRSRAVSFPRRATIDGYGVLWNIRKYVGDNCESEHVGDDTETIKGKEIFREFFVAGARHTHHRHT